jgi:hypothetical protein
MGSPASVPDAISAINGAASYHFFQIAELAFRTANLQSVHSIGHGNSRRVITAILKTTQAINDYRNNLLLTDVTDYSAHERLPAAAIMYETRRSGKGCEAGFG